MHHHCTVGPVWLERSEFYSRIGLNYFSVKLCKKRLCGKHCGPIAGGLKSPKNKTQMPSWTVTGLTLETFSLLTVIENMFSFQVIQLHQQTYYHEHQNPALTWSLILPSWLSQAQQWEELLNLDQWGGPHKNHIHGERRKHEESVWKVLQRS